MKIIRFPGNYQPSNPVPTGENKLATGVQRFTCDCGTTAEIDFKNLIFRYMDFFCACCGTHYKVTNPAFKPRGPKT